MLGYATFQRQLQFGSLLAQQAFGHLRQFVAVALATNDGIQSGLLVLVVEIAIFILFVLFGLSRVGRYFLSKVVDDEDAYFILMILTMSLAAALASLIQLPDIVGAFLAGLAVNAAARDQPAEEKLNFFGEALFVLCFFIVTGFLINPPEFWRSITQNACLASAVLFALLAGKWIAAQIAGKAFGYSSLVRMTIRSLTLPQVAATIAAAIVAFNTFDSTGERLIGSELLNVLVLMVTTSILGPLLTERLIPRLLVSPHPAKAA